MRKKGFTLLELIVVVIILGILATLGLTQYGRMIERSRGAEARSILGGIRKYAAAEYMEFNTVAGFTNAKAGIGASLDQVPSACRTSHYFSYNVAVANPTVTMTATRCTAGGKTPDNSVADTLILTSNLSTGVDAWSGSGSY